MSADIIFSSLRLSTPLVFAALGGMLSERAGVINIALEGFMLLGAFGGAVGTLVTHNPWLGALCGILAGVLLAAVYAGFVIEFRANQVVAGTAINMLALGLTPVLCKAWYDVTGSTPAIPISQRFQSAPIWLALAATVLAWAFMRYTRWGLRFTVAGEHAEALETAGVRVNRVRWVAVLAAGGLAALGGVALSVYLSSSFTRNISGGRGFMALAALIAGKWKPERAALACLIFGLGEAWQIRLQSTFPIPVQFIQILPYFLTILVLAGFVGRARAPRNLGIPFRRR
jgi:general nucleoside transport system permease protein